MAEAAGAAASGGIVRRGALDHLRQSINGVSITPAAPARRVSLRARPEGLSALSLALGVEIPTTPKTSRTANGRSVLWLGPDEWLVIDSGQGDPAGDLQSVSGLHSAVDISHRNTAIEVQGEKAADVLNAGCPQDLGLQAFPVGACSRTVMGKIEIVLFRTAPDAFHVECWRSFADYAFSYLSDAARGV